MRARELLPLLLLGLLATSSTGSSADRRLVFVVNRSNPIDHLTPSEVSNYFLKRQSHWPDGTPVRFIDHEAGSSARAIFLQRVIQKSPREVDLYWIGQKLYSGNSAPIQVSRDAMVLNFVAKFKGAIGYILESGTSLPSEVKSVPVTSNP
jgi:hypothetical protein